MHQRMRLKSADAAATLASLEAHLKQLSPLAILDRGYALVTREGEQAGVKSPLVKSAPLVKSPEDAPPGTNIRVRLAKGELRRRVLK